VIELLRPDLCFRVGTPLLEGACAHFGKHTSSPKIGFERVFSMERVAVGEGFSVLCNTPHMVV